MNLAFVGFLPPSSVNAEERTFVDLLSRSFDRTVVFQGIGVRDVWHGRRLPSTDNRLFGHLLGGWRLAVGLGAVVLARLAPGSLGVCLGRALGEGSCLALAGAGGLVELAAAALVLGLQVAEASLKGLAAGTRDGLHTSIIGEAHAAAAHPRLRSRD